MPYPLLGSQEIGHSGQKMTNNGWQKDPRNLCLTFAIVIILVRGEGRKHREILNNERSLGNVFKKWLF